MQFLWKYVDELVGKGLEWYLVAELLFYASANLVPMALPLAILLASIMTFGSFGEHYELVAMKSGGMGLLRIMYPLLLVTMLTSGAAFLFTNYVWPKANLEFASLLYDIRHKKPTFDISEGVYYDGIDGYVIRVEEKEEDGQRLKDVLIYDHSDKKGNGRMVRAEKGRMEMSSDQMYLIFTLWSGTSYEEVEEDGRPHMKSEFEEEVIRFDLSGFQMERTDKDIFKDNYQMLNLKQLSLAIDTYDIVKQERMKDYHDLLIRKTLPTKLDTHQITQAAADSAKQHQFAAIFTEQRLELLETAISQLRSNRTFVESKQDLINSNQKSINRHLIEWHRKFTLSFACIILFFIGAPLGAIIRRGGLGLPVVISVLFFLVYHITSISFEKMAKQGQIDPEIGMWVASAVLLPIGLFLTYKASTDSRLLDMDTYTKTIAKFFERFKPSASIRNSR